MASYDRINYTLRPAKSIERKMLCEAFRKLSYIAEPNEYKYIGFGSPFFSDFTLVHKTLGIHDMVSIEKEVEDKNRFKFNRPFKCIELLFGNSNDILPQFRWIKKTILWLDYDYKLDNSMLTDVGTFMANAKSGSIILLTMDVTAYELATHENKKMNRIVQFKEKLDKNKIPIGVSEGDMDQLNYPKVCFRIINNEIQEDLLNRNGGLIDKLCYKQLFNFYYKDGSSPMLTIGGIIYQESDKDKINKCSFDKLGFTSCNNMLYEPYEIVAPKLTFREMRYLDQNLLIHNPNEKKHCNILSQELINNYRKVYRYFPNFVEAEVH